MTQVEAVIEKLGGVTAAARTLGLSHVSIIRWQHRGQVPAARVPAVSAASGMPRHTIRPDLYEAPAGAEAA